MFSGSCIVCFNTMNFMSRMHSQAAYEERYSSTDSSFSSQMDVEYTFPRQEEQSFAYYPPHQQFCPQYNARQELTRPPTPETSFRQPRYHVWSDAEVPQYNPQQESARPILGRLPSSHRSQSCSSSQAGRKRSWQEVDATNLPAAKRSALPLVSTVMSCRPEEGRAAEQSEERKRIVRQMKEQLGDKEIELDNLR